MASELMKTERNSYLLSLAPFIQNSRMAQEERKGGFRETVGTFSKEEKENSLGKMDEERLSGRKSGRREEKWKK